MGKFSVVDYVVFAAMLLVSSAIGIYHAYGGKQNSTKEYLMAGRQMSAFPIFVSLLASYLSAITLLGVPSEIYTYGIQYVVLILSYLFLVTTAAVIYAPLFYKLQITSANEYLERRFSVGVRYLGCFLFMLQYVLYLSVVLYAPSLALEAVAGVPLAASIVSTGLVCNFYTTLGGMKAVIWTDVFQAGVMVAGLIVVIIVGTIHIGSFSAIFDIAEKGERMKIFDFNPDPTIRNSFWTLTIGGAFTAMPVWTISQTAVQRFLSAKTLRECKKAIWFNIPGLILVVALCVIDGLVIYAVYHGCDLLKDKKITSNDQVLPYFIIDKLGHLKGVPGIFTACLFSGALSTASSGLNSIAAIALEDIVKKRHPDISELWATRISKIVACSVGLLIIGGAFLVSLVGTMVLQLAYSIFGIIGGPYLGVFALGILVPWARKEGAYFGCFLGVATTLWIAIGAQVYPPHKYQAVVSIAKCDDFNATIAKHDGRIYPQMVYHEPAIAKFYSISYLWYAAIGISFTFLGGYILSFILNVIDKKRGTLKTLEVDPRLIFDWQEFLWSLLPNRMRPAKYRFRKDDANDIAMQDGAVLVGMQDTTRAKEDDVLQEHHGPIRSESTEPFANSVVTS